MCLECGQEVKGEAGEGGDGEWGPQSWAAASLKEAPLKLQARNACSAGLREETALSRRVVLHCSDHSEVEIAIGEMAVERWTEWLWRSELSEKSVGHSLSRTPQSRVSWGLGERQGWQWEPACSGDPASPERPLSPAALRVAWDLPTLQAEGFPEALCLFPSRALIDVPCFKF